MIFGKVMKMMFMLVLVFLSSFSCALAVNDKVEIVELRASAAMGAGTLNTLDVLVRNDGLSTLNNVMVVLEVGGKKGTSSYFSLNPSQIHNARVIFEAPEKAGTYLAVVKVEDKDGDVLSSKAFYLTFSPVSIQIEMLSSVKEGEVISVEGSVFVGSEPVDNDYVSIYLDGRSVKMEKVVEGKFSTTIVFDEPEVHEISVKYGKNKVSKRVYVEAVEDENDGGESAGNLEMPVGVVPTTGYLQLIQGEGNMLKINIKNNDQRGVFEVRARVVEGDIDVRAPAPFFMEAGEEKTVGVFVNGKVVGEGMIEIVVLKNGEEVWKSNVEVNVVGKSLYREVELPFIPSLKGAAIIFAIFVFVMIMAILPRKREMVAREPVSKELRKIASLMKKGTKGKPLKLEEVKKAAKLEIYPARREQIIY